jgi:uncharacterized protein (DUF488 family)
VRGREYAWANAQRLQAALTDAGIEACAASASGRTASSPRSTPKRYRREILDQADLDAVVARMPEDSTTALLCVERDPEACHRSLVAHELAEAYGLDVVHLFP